MTEISSLFGSFWPPSYQQLLLRVCEQWWLNEKVGTVYRNALCSFHSVELIEGAFLKFGSVREMDMRVTLEVAYWLDSDARRLFSDCPRDVLRGK